MYSIGRLGGLLEQVTSVSPSPPQSPTCVYITVTILSTWVTCNFWVKHFIQFKNPLLVHFYPNLTHSNVCSVITDDHKINQICSSNVKSTLTLKLFFILWYMYIVPFFHHCHYICSFYTTYLLHVPCISFPRYILNVMHYCIKLCL